MATHGPVENFIPVPGHLKALLLNVIQISSLFLQ